MLLIHFYVIGNRFFLPEHLPPILHADFPAQQRREDLHKAVGSHARLLSAMISITFRFESSSHFLLKLLIYKAIPSFDEVDRFCFHHHNSIFNSIQQQSGIKSHL